MPNQHELDPIHEVIDPDPSWREQAECRGLDVNIFHPQRGEDAEKAKRICRTCVVAERCLQYALDNNIKVGVYGGMSGHQRREHKQKLRGGNNG